MKKLLFTVFVATLITIGLQAQEYKVSQSTGTLILHNIDEVSITGYDGTEVIFKTDYDNDDEEEARAKGLRMLNSSGLTDNTGLGISVTKKDGNVIVEKVGNNCDCDLIEIMLPKNMGVAYDHNNYNGSDVILSGIAGEIEVSAMYNDVILKNVTGPMAVKSVYGSVEAIFSSVNQSGSISLNSIYDFVDITVPAASKCNVTVDTPYGNIYSDIEINVNTTDSGMRQISGSKVRGTINGGGVDMTLKSSYENVYIRSN